MPSQISIKMNKPIFVLIFSLFFLNHSTFAQKTIALFNKKNLVNWYAFEPETGKHLNAADLFTVSDKKIRMYGKKAAYLMSMQSFKNFKLTAKFRWNTDSTLVQKDKKRNSGIMYNVPTDTPDELWPKGVQFQIKDGAMGDFVFLKNTTATIKNKQTEAGKSVVAPHFIDAVKADKKWNTLVVTNQNGHVIQYLNGKLVNEATNVTANEGRILLQYEGSPIDFKSINIQNLDN